MADVCTPCSKNNHPNCLYEVVDPYRNNGEVTECACAHCAQEQCESCGQPTASEECDHGKLLCAGCSNECRSCVDIAGREEAVDRQLAEARGGGYDLG